MSYSFEDRKSELKNLITKEKLYQSILDRYTFWDKQGRVAPEPNLTLTELTCGVYEDCLEERAFRTYILSHAKRLLNAMVKEGKIRASGSLNRQGKPCSAYAPNLPEYP